MIRLAPVLFSVACVSTAVSGTGMHQLEFSCEDLLESGGQGGAYVEVVLVEDVDPQGWVAVLGSEGSWEEAEGVHVGVGDLRLDGACPQSQALRLSWW